MAPSEVGKKQKAAAATGQGTHKDEERKPRRSRIWLWIIILLLLALLCFAAFHFGFISFDEARHLHFNLTSNASSYAVH